MSLMVVSLELEEANRLVAAWHRHHKPVIGHRFSIGVVDESGTVHGAAVVGRPVARMAGSPRAVVEVARLVTDGTPNACSMLYAACARAAKAMGFERIQTYILEEEPGTSLKAAGWIYEGPAGGGSWVRESRPENNRLDQPMTRKGRWALALNTPRPLAVLPENVDEPSLWSA